MVRTLFIAALESGRSLHISLRECLDPAHEIVLHAVNLQRRQRQFSEKYNGALAMVYSSVCVDEYDFSLF